MFRFLAPLAFILSAASVFASPVSHATIPMPLTVVGAHTEASVADYAIVIFKYDARVNVWQRMKGSDSYDVTATGALYRSFPTGPKVVLADERIPEGIYTASVDEEGNVSFRFETIPGVFEIYRITGASLDRNVIPLRAEAIEAVRHAAKEMYEAGARSIPLVILPGTLESDVAETLGRASRVREGQTLADVEASVRRWKPVEEYMINTGRIPRLRFEGADIIILDEAVPKQDSDGESLAGETRR